MITPTSVPEWVAHPGRDSARAGALARDLDAPLAVAHVLVNRGVADAGTARRFLDPSLEDLHDPFLLRDLEPAVLRIRRALETGERIFVHGDYDVDGITSAFLLVAVLRELGGRVEVRIPHRTRDGYGLSVDAVEDARRRGCGLVITVDCGITAVAAVERARALGLDTIVTDHHPPPPVLPAALALVNPLRPGCGYPFKALAGVGVTFKLAEALGTIADVVPLVGENRVLARLGLACLNQTRRVGLKALMDVAGLGARPISSGQVAFVLAPRINAGGRMGNAEQGLRLLLARDAGEAKDLAQSLEDDNEMQWPDCSCILLWSERWHPGVIGIVASRLVERFQRPVVLVALDGERGRGSGRSLPGLDLNAVLGECADLLDAWGGHAFAAGLTVQRARLPELRERLNRLVRERIPLEAFVPRLIIDADVHLGECGRPLLDWIDRTAPHGLGNPEPLFQAANLIVDGVSTAGQGRHLRLQVRDATGSAQAIGFGLGDRADEVARARRCSLAFALTRNEWMGETRVQLKVKGVHCP